MKNIYKSAAFIVCAAMMSSGYAASFSADQQKEIEKIVERVITTRPELMVNAQQAMQKKSMEARVAKNLDATKKNVAELFKPGDNLVIGNTKGKVTAVMFFDYYCGHCRNMVPVFETLTKNNSNLRVIERVTPIFGDKSMLIAKVAIASERQDKFAKLHALFMNNGSMGKMNTKEDLMNLAKQAGLDTAKLAKDMESKSVKDEIDNNIKLAGAVTGGSIGTPIIIVGKTNKTSLEKLKYFPGEVPAKLLQDAIDSLK